MKIITNTGKEFSASWCAVSTIDGLLRLNVISHDYATVFATFIDPDETEKITYIKDDMESETIFEGYTAFKGINVSGDEIIVSLGRT